MTFQYFEVKTANNLIGPREPRLALSAQRSLTSCTEWEYPGGTHPGARFGWVVQPFGLEVE
jgi:hypothetical protein